VGKLVSGKPASAALGVNHYMKVDEGGLRF